MHCMSVSSASSVRYDYALETKQCTSCRRPQLTNVVTNACRTKSLKPCPVVPLQRCTPPGIVSMYNTGKARTRCSIPPVRSSNSGGPNSEDPDSDDPFDRVLELLVDYATAGCLAVIIGVISGVPALGNFHLSTDDITFAMLVMAPIYVLDVLMMVPDFQATAKLRTKAELAEELGIDTAGLTGSLTKKMVVFDSQASYYKWLLDGNQVDCIVNDPTINIPAAPRLFLIVASAFAEEMLFRAVLVTLLGRGLAAGIIAGGLEDVAPWGPSGTGAVAACFVFAAMIALVPISKVQKAMTEATEVEVLVRSSSYGGKNSSSGGSSNSNTESDDTMGSLKVSQAETLGGKGRSATQTSSTAPARFTDRNADSLSSSGSVPKEVSNGVASYTTTTASTSSGQTIVTAMAPVTTSSISSSSSKASSDPAQESTAVLPEGLLAWPYVDKKLNPFALYKAVQGTRNVAEVLLLNLVFVFTGNLAASFVANAVMQVVFTGYQINGETRVKTASKSS